MDENEITPQKKLTPAQERLAQFSRKNNNKSAHHHAAYTTFIRRMRLFLPLAAIAVMAALFTWPVQEKDIAILKDEQKEALKTVSKNELESPKFESVDEKNQPYTITADKAVQKGEQKDILLLTNPVGSLQMNNGNTIRLKADDGTYWQTDEKLFLQQNVRLSNNDGYEMLTRELHIDLAARTATTDTDVEAFGPAGTLTAKGLKGDNQANTLIFNGPAKLVLTDAGSLNGLGGAKKEDNSDVQ